MSLSLGSLRSHNDFLPRTVQLLMMLMLFSSAAQASITARVTMTTYSAFASQNATPGQAMFFIANVPNAGNNYTGVANNNNARLNISGNVTNATVNLGSTAGYFTMAFNNGNFSQATGCATSPIDFNTSTQHLSDGSTIDVTITCSIPDTTPPVQQSAATDTAGTTLTITFSESVASSWADQTDFKVTAGGSNIVISNVSYSGSTAILTLASPVYSGQTVLVSYTDNNSALVDDFFNEAATFSNLAVTNRSTATTSSNSVPGAPTGVTATPGNGQATVSWTAPSSNGGATITGYTVTTSPGGATCTTTGATTCTVTGLTNGAAYTFGVTATNSVGTGAAGTSASVTIGTSSSQTITFGTAPTIIMGHTGTVSATASSGLAVTFTSSTPTICTVSGSTVTGVATGTCTIAADQAGNSSYNAAPEVTQTLAVTAQPDHAIQFPAANDYGTGVISGVSGPFTVEFWVAFTDLTNQQNFLVLASNGGYATNRIVPYKDASGNINLFVMASGITTIITSGVKITDTTWHHFAFTYDGTRVSIFIDGQATAAAAASITGTLSFTGTNDSLIIAADAAGTYNAQVALDEVRIWNTARSLSDILTTMSSTLTGTESGLIAAYQGDTTTGTTLPNISSAGSAENVSLVNTTDANWVVSGAMHPFMSSVSGISTSSFTANWYAAYKLNGTTVDGYRIDVASDSTFNTLLVNNQDAGAGTSTTLTGLSLTPGSTYYVRLRSVISSWISPNSAGFAFTVPASQAQTITFGAAPAVFVGSTGTVSATGGASGNPVTFTSTTTDVCTVSGSTVTGVTAGTCTIAANQAGNSSYSAAPQVTQTFSIGQGSQIITFGTAPTVIVGGTGAVAATGGASGNSVTFTSTTTGVCTVSGSTVTGVTAGTCIIAANQAGNSNYSAASPVTQTFSVGKGSQTIVFGTLPTVVVGGTGTIAATGGASGNAVTFTATTTDVCTVSGSTVTGIATGACNLVANQAGDANYNAAVAATASIVVGANGHCGSANNTIVATTPTDPSALCSVGTASAVTGSGPWSWSCAGTNGGSTASCTAIHNSPTLTTPSLSGGAVGVPYSVIMQASGGVLPYHFSATGLPSGFSLDSETGVLHGTSEAPVAATVAISVTDSLSQSNSQSYPLTITDQVTVATTTLPKGIQGAPYDQTILAVGGKTPYTWALAPSSVALPDGMSLNVTTGEVNGTLSITTPVSFTVLVTDSDGQTATQALTLTALPASIAVTDSVSQASVSANLTPANAGSGCGVDVSNSQTRIIHLGDSGAPANGPTDMNLPYGLFQLTVRGCTPGEEKLTLTLVYPNALPPGTQYWKYGSTADNATAHWYVFPGTIVQGNSVTFNITDGGLGDDDLTANGVITDPGAPANPTLTIHGTPTNAQVGVAYYVALTASSSNSGGGPYNWSISHGSLPPGISLDATTGVLSGTPTSSGVFAFTVQLIDTGHGNLSTTQNYTVTTSLTDQGIGSGGNAGNGGGGGSLDPWSLVLLLALLGWRSLWVRRMMGVAVLALLSIGTTQAAGTSTAGEGEKWYLGAGVGLSTTTASSAPLVHDLTVQGTPTAIQEDRHDWGWQVYGGWQLNAWSSVELGYVDLGQVDSTVTISNAVTSTVRNLIGAEHPFMAAGPTLAGLGWLPLGNHMSAYGKLGVIDWHGRVQLPLIGVDHSLHGTDPLFGIGLQTQGNALGPFAIRLGVDGFQVMDHWQYLWALGLNYRF